MDDRFQIESLERPDDAAWTAIGGGIHAYNETNGGASNGRSVCFVLRAPDGTIAGGLIGETHWDWLYVNLLWLEESLRGRGYGHRLLTLAEDEGRRRGATRAYLDTFSFQAPEFYRRHGYEVFGVLSDFPPGHERYYLTKRL